MTSFVLAGLALCASLGVSSIQGQVVGPDSHPVAHAQVFIEPGLGGELRDTITADDGSFRFDGVAPGAMGIFAVAPGYGFEGQHVTLAVGDTLPALRIILHPAVEIRGAVADHNGKPVEGARITRIGVKTAHKVGVPLAKLKAYGYAEPVTDAKGKFVLGSVPEGALIDLKVGHPSFAQEGVVDVAAGTADARVALHPGVLIEGEVRSRANQTTVGQAAVLVRNAQPPHDTATTRANLSGRFSMRLKPGVYAYQAYGAGLRSAGWEQLTITGARPIEQVRVSVAGTGSIRGNIRDAITGDPVRGVRVSLMTNGTNAAVARTGPGGDFLFTAGEGENIVRLDSTPGYFPPDTQHVKLTILEGNEIELPGMWLKPLPDYAVQVIDGAGNPVPGAVVSILRPRQLGWYVAGEDGTARIQVRQFPADGVLLGRAEHPAGPQAALFRLEEHQNGPAAVQLFNTGVVEGRVVNARGRAIAGASVGAFFPGEAADDAVGLWQTFTDGEGHFRWLAVVPGVPQRCAARTAA
ncbi:MAG: carboxypeptidase-like regulatory domain-containing protein, partial [Gammaproteobacteria bacterium]|nr:carboxypeptidase-like regulatory domain-containing protein [Gammaproteobacteria bacterium]